MNPPRIYTCSPSWTPLPPPSPYHPSGSSQCTSPEHAVSCMWPPLFDPTGCISPDSSVHGISQTRILEWVATSFSRGSSGPRDWTQVSCIAGRLFIHWATWKALIWQNMGLITCRYSPSCTWRNKLEGSVIISKEERSPSPWMSSAFSSRHPAREASRFFPGQQGCWPCAWGPVPALLLGAFPAQGCSLLPSCELTTQNTILTCHISVKPKHTVSHPVLQSRAAALGTMPLQSAVLCIHNKDLGAEMLPAVQW